MTAHRRCYHMKSNSKCAWVLPVSMCSVLYRAGMTPNVTLHWFAHPQWFQDLGEFQKEENIPLFVNWAETAFALFGMHTLFWLVCMNAHFITTLCARGCMQLCCTLLHAANLSLFYVLHCIGKTVHTADMAHLLFGWYDNLLYDNLLQFQTPDPAAASYILILIARCSAL